MARVHYLHGKYGNSNLKRLYPILRDDQLKTRIDDDCMEYNSFGAVQIVDSDAADAVQTER